MVLGVNLETIVKYVRVSPIMSGLTLASVGTGIYSVPQAIKNYSEGDIIAGSAYTALSVGVAVSTVVSQLDARSRFREYKRFKNIFSNDGLKERILKQISHSKCQRDAAKIAAEDLGYRKEIEDYFDEGGYQWYHLMPDKIREDPLYLFNPNFWRTSLFSRRSKS